MVTCIILQSLSEYAGDHLTHDLHLQSAPPVKFSVLLTAKGGSGCALSACMLRVYKHIRTPWISFDELRAQQRMQIALAQSMKPEHFTAATGPGPLLIPLQSIFI